MKNKFSLAATIVIFYLFASCSGDHHNSQKNQPNIRQHVVLVSIDGFRYDFAEKFGAENLLKISESGIKAESLIPCYPSKTFPNHYSIITGLYPDNHGIVDNYFYDSDWEQMFSLNGKNTDNGKWFGGTPLWELANSQGLKSASYFWIGSDMNINGQSPTYFYPYNESTPNAERVNQVIEWLKLPEETRPQLITLYFSDVDTQGHEFGPDSEETKAAVLDIDAQIGRLHNEISSFDFPIDLVIVSDHGITALDSTKGIDINELIADNNEHIKYIPRDALLMVYLRDSSQIDQVYKELKEKELERFTTHRRQDIPEHLHFGQNKRVGDILLIPNPPYSFTLPNVPIDGGTHGYDPYSVKDMHGIFYAIGPNFKKGNTLSSFENINIYPLLAEILKLDYSSVPIDGKLTIVESALDLENLNN